MALFKLHLKYLLNKVNVILLITMFTILMITMMTSSKLFTSFSEKWFMKKNNQVLYESTILNIFKFLIPFFSIYFFGHSYLKKQDNYVIMIVKNRYERIKYFISKIVCIQFIITIFLIAVFEMYLFFGYISICKFIPNFKFWIEVYLISLIYGLFTTTFTLLINHSLLYIIIMLGYLILNIIYELNEIMIVFFPIYFNLEYYKLWILVVPICFYFCISLLIYFFSDL